jgi:hypothetical protein
MKLKRNQDEKGAIELTEEAFHLLRSAPSACLIGYFIGTLPFVLGLLYFWSDMARSAFAEERLVPGTFALCGLFLWMKCWHAVYAQQLLAHLCGEPPPALTVPLLLKAALHQAIIQPIGLFILPISLALLVPTGWTYAFFTNATVFSGTAPDLRTLIGKSWKQARLWSMQSHYLVFLFKVFGLFVFLNIMSAVMLVPILMKTFLGVETVFSQSPWAAMNTTLLAAAACLTFLCIDPFLKATYVLRCFYGESLATGQDLKAELRTFATPPRLATVALLAVLINLSPLPVSAAGPLERTPNAKPGTENSLPAPTLDRSIDEVIHQREYTWRSPRDSAPAKPKSPTDENFLDQLFTRIESALREGKRWIQELVEWLNRQGGRKSGASLDGLSLAGAIRGIIYLLIIALAGVLIWLLIRLWNRRGPSEEIAAEALPAVPDVADENVGADQLPEDGWMTMARDLLNRGELRLALRAFYLATLAHLAERNLITLARFKSNRDYEREVARRGHALPEVPGMFAENITTFERVWYGAHEVTPDMLQHFSGNVEKMKAHA